MGDRPAADAGRAAEQPLIPDRFIDSVLKSLIPAWINWFCAQIVDSGEGCRTPAGINRPFPAFALEPHRRGGFTQFISLDRLTVAASLPSLETMYIILISACSAVGLFLGMLAILEVGRRKGMKRLAADPDATRAGTGAVDGAVFALFGLLIAFTFSGAASRFDARRQLIVEEANDIGTAYLRIDLLPADAQPTLRESFRRYLDSRLDTYRKMPDVDAAMQEMAKSTKLQDEIWTRSVAACRARRRPGHHVVGRVRSQRHDRYHDHPCHGRQDPPAGDRLCAAVRVGSGVRTFGRLRHGRQQAAELGTHDRLLGHHVDHLLRDPRYRISTARLHPRGCNRSGSR